MTTQLRQGQPVEQARPHHRHGPRQEVGPRQQVVQHVPRQDGRHYDGDGGGETFEDVVSELDGGGHYQAAERLEDDDGQHRPVVAVEDAPGGDLLTGVVDHPGEREEEGKQTQLEIPDDDWGLTGGLDQLLVVDPGVAWWEAGHEDRHEAGQLILLLLWVLGLSLGYLDHGDPHHQEE